MNLLQKLWWWISTKTVCAWKTTHQHSKRHRGNPLAWWISHGICKECMNEELRRHNIKTKG